MTRLTGAISWYPEEHWRIEFNYGYGILDRGGQRGHFNVFQGHAGVYQLVHPRSGRMPLGLEVPELHAEGYREACWVLSDSPKASAALSRRSLQLLLRDVAKVKPSDLNKEIDEVLAAKSLASTSGKG